MKTIFYSFAILVVCQLSPAQENPNEKLDYLIGTWKLELKSMGMTAFMDFEWGRDKTYVLKRNRNVRNGVTTYENTSMIAWDGVRGKFIVNQVYHGKGSLLIGQGTLEFKDGVIARDIMLHYAEGQKVPFKEITAGKGGETMGYRQRWTIIDDKHFKGYMEVELDSGWTNPFKDSEDGEELWEKVK